MAGNGNRLFGFMLGNGNRLSGFAICNSPGYQALWWVTVTGYQALWCCSSPSTFFSVFDLLIKTGRRREILQISLTICSFSRSLSSYWPRFVVLSLSRHSSMWSISRPRDLDNSSILIDLCTVTFSICNAAYIRRVTNTVGKPETIEVWWLWSAANTYYNAWYSLKNIFCNCMNKGPWMIYMNGRAHFMRYAEIWTQCLLLQWRATYSVALGIDSAMPIRSHN